jgi:RimJ/RimL family protein N-acetyltransferase
LQILLEEKPLDEKNPLGIDCANIPSCKLAEKCGFELFEKRTPIGHVQPNTESDSYYYYRLYRKKA